MKLVTSFQTSTHETFDKSWRKMEKFYSKTFHRNSCFTLEFVDLSELSWLRLHIMNDELHLLTLS